MQGGPGDGAPAVEFAISPVVSRFEDFGLQQGRAKNDMARVIEVPVAGKHAAFADHAGVELGSWIGRLDMEGGGGDALLDGPVDGAPEDVFAVVIHAEDKAAVDHDAE